MWQALKRSVGLLLNLQLSAYTAGLLLLPSIKRPGCLSSPYPHAQTPAATHTGANCVHGSHSSSLPALLCCCCHQESAQDVCRQHIYMLKHLQQCSLCCNCAYAGQTCVRLVLHLHCHAAIATKNAPQMAIGAISTCSNTCGNRHSAAFVHALVAVKFLWTSYPTECWLALWQLVIIAMLLLLLLVVMT